ncbi:MAG: polysaccharide lyase [Pseudomonadota bacterium]
MGRITKTLALAMLLASFVTPPSAQAADRAPRATGCAAFGSADWWGPQRLGPLGKAWPLTSGDRPAWNAHKARVTPARDGPVVEVVYPEGSINPGNPRAPVGGLGFLDRLPSGEGRAGCLSYEVRFQPGFAFGKGGKLPGLWGGHSVAGCAKRTDGGFSTRFMWNRHGQGFVYAYLADRDSRCGESIGFQRGQKRINFTPGKWHRLEQLVALNTPGRADGVLQVWFDGELMIDQRNVLYRESDRVRIDGLMFSTFFGGSSKGNASPQWQKSWFRGFEYRRLGRRG